MRIKDEREMLALGRKLAAALKPGDAVTLSGPLSAGKTTLVRGLLAGLGNRGEVPSPSFAIVQPYDVPEVRLPVAHVDLYRLDDAAEAEELALGDYLMDSLLIIEWPDRLGDGLWPHSLRLSIDFAGEDARRLTARSAPRSVRPNN